MKEPGVNRGLLIAGAVVSAGAWLAVRTVQQGSPEGHGSSLKLDLIMGAVTLVFALPAIDQVRFWWTLRVLSFCVALGCLYGTVNLLSNPSSDLLGDVHNLAVFVLFGSACLVYTFSGRARSALEDLASNDSVILRFLGKAAKASRFVLIGALVVIGVVVILRGIAR